MVSHDPPQPDTHCCIIVGEAGQPAAIVIGVQAPGPAAHHPRQQASGIVVLVVDAEVVGVGQADQGAGTVVGVAGGAALVGGLGQDMAGLVPSKGKRAAAAVELAAQAVEIVIAQHYGAV